MNNLSLDDQIILAKIISVFDRINNDCAKTGEGVVPFSSDPSTVEFYEEQMENIEYDQHEIDLFSNWLKSIPGPDEKPNIVKIDLAKNHPEFVHLLGRFISPS